MDGNKDLVVTNMMRCPSCDVILTALGDSPFDPNLPKEARPDGPQPGDMTVCVYCLAILKFSGDLTLMAITAEEWAALPKDVAEGLIVLQFAVQRAFKGARGGRERGDPEAN